MYARRGFGAERKLVSIFVVVRGNGVEDRKIGVARVLILRRCLVKRDAEGF